MISLDHETFLFWQQRAALAAPNTGKGAPKNSARNHESLVNGA